MPQYALIKTLIHNAQAQQCRQLIVMAGDLAWATAALKSVLPLLPHVLWMGDDAPEAVKSCAINGGKQFLGAELNHVIVNAHSGLHPNSFAAMAGSIKAGHLLLLLTPPLEQWADTPDADYKRMQSFGCTSSQQYFIARLAQQLTQQAITVWSQGKVIPTLEKALVSVPQAPVPAPFKSQDQKTAYEHVLKVALGHRRRPLVLTAKRGRGKSSVLGLAANHLMAEYQKQIIVVAPQRSAVDALFDKIEVEYRRQIEFMLPSDLERIQPKADVLLVDEAAGIPIPLLRAWLKRYSRVVFSTTSYGYEGYGQGFTLRFTPELEAYAPQYKRYSPEQAIRWHTPDPLEQCVDAMFLFDLPLPAVSAPIALSYREIKQVDLGNDEPLLKQVYGLLIGAHYQTTPDDLRMLMDGAHTHIMAAFSGLHLVGVALLGEEGGLPTELHHDICAARRRVAGHLAPQLVAATTANSSLLAQKSWRVIRIAVHPQFRQQGIGKGLLAFIQTQAQPHQIDALTACFGLQPELLQFWDDSGFKAVAISAKQDAASGAFSGVVFKPMSASAQESLLCLQSRLKTSLPYALRDYLNKLDVDTTIALINSLANGERVLEVDQLSLFAHGNKTLVSCLPELTALALSGGDVLNVAYRFLIMRVLLAWPMPAIVKRTEVSGKAELMRRLREYVQRVL